MKPKNFIRRLPIFFWYLIKKPFIDLLSLIIGGYKATSYLESPKTIMIITFGLMIIFIANGMKGHTYIIGVLFIFAYLVYEWRKGDDMKEYREKRNRKIQEKIYRGEI